MMLGEGHIRKMSTTLDGAVRYRLELNRPVEMNELIGKYIRIEWNGEIRCRSCEKVTRKSFGEGYCYPCFASAPEASECNIRPELCRAHLGEGRDAAWEEMHHNQPHIVYLAASDIVKVGVTRVTQIPTRWIDQGARSAIRLAETPNRYEAGRLEVALKSFYADKTNWQRMLRNELDESIDLVTEKWELHEKLPSDLTEFFSENDEVILIEYPVNEYPQRVKSLSFNKSPVIEGVLNGIKGQYLIFADGQVINLRKYTSYYVRLSEVF